MHPVIYAQLALIQGRRTQPSQPKRPAASLPRRLWRRTTRPGRQLATGDADVTPTAPAVVVTPVSVADRPAWTRATCTAPNCAGHRARP
jgi:hypothetical protein